MDQLKALYKLGRPLTTLSGVLAVFLGGYVAGTGAWLNIFLAGITTMLISAAANAWNDYLDVEIDRINQPKRPLPSGKVSLRAARWFSFILAALSLLTASFINWPAFLIALLSNVILYIYSLRLKSTVLLGNATVATISALSAVFGGVAAGNVAPTLWLALIIFLAIMGREVLKTMADYEGDLSQRCRTIATVWGRRKARIVFYILVAATLIVMMLPYLTGYYGEAYAYIVAFGVYPVVIYIMLHVSQERTGYQLERMSQLMKYDYLIWFLAVLVGA